MDVMKRLLYNNERAKLEKKTRNKKKSIEKKKTKLTKKLIDAADSINLRNLKIDANPKSRRLKFMYFVEDVTNISSVFDKTVDIMKDYPVLTWLAALKEYVSFELFVFISAHIK